MPSKHPTPQGISALLRKAGFARHGDPGRSGGYSCGHAETGGVRVHYVAPRGGLPETAKEMLAQYAETITGAGWTVETGEHDLTVTSPKEG